MEDDSYFTSKGLPEPPDSDFKRSSGIPKPGGDFGQTFDHLYEASLVSVIAALAATLGGLLFPERGGLSAEKIAGKASAAFIVCFAAKRTFYRLRAKKQEKVEAAMAGSARRLELTPSA